MQRIRKGLATATLVLFGIAAWADGMTVFVNGVKYPDEPIEVGTQTVYPLSSLAQAMGVTYSMNANGAFLNGIALKSPAVLVGGKAYATLDVATRTVGATMTRDPVRSLIQITCMAKMGGGFSYYDKDYKTPAQAQLDEADRKAAAEGHPMQASMQRTYAKSMKEYEDKMPANLKTQMPDIDLPEAALPSMSAGTGSLELPKAPSTDPNSYMEKKPNATLGTNTVPQATPTYYNVREAANGTFKLIIKDVRIAEVLKGMDPPAEPQPGNRFVVIYLEEENLTKSYQSPSWFAIHDLTGAAYAPDPNLSQFSLAALRGHETSTGFLVCQMPVQTLPSSIEMLCNPPLSLTLNPSIAP